MQVAYAAIVAVTVAGLRRTYTVFPFTRPSGRHRNDLTVVCSVGEEKSTERIRSVRCIEITLVIASNFLQIIPAEFLQKCSSRHESRHRSRSHAALSEEQPIVRDFGRCCTDGARCALSLAPKGGFNGCQTRSQANEQPLNGRANALASARRAI